MVDHGDEPMFISWGRFLAHKKFNLEALKLTGSKEKGSTSIPFEMAEESVDCAVCGANKPSSYKARMYSIGPHRFHLVRCRACGFVYVNPRPDGPTLARLYEDPDYFAKHYNLGVETKNYFARKDELLVHYDKEVADLEGKTGMKGDLLELGSAGGFFIEAARRRGWRVRGVEISSTAARFSIDEFGLNVFQGILEDASFEKNSFDLAVADNVLEHTTSPMNVLENLNRLLRPGGYLLVIVPAYVNSIFFRMLHRMGAFMPKFLLDSQLLRILKVDPEQEGIPPYHILEFNRSTLLRLLRRAGYELISVQGSVPMPAHLFKRGGTSLKERILRGIFRGLNRLMLAGLIPGVSLRVLARKPASRA